MTHTSGPDKLPDKLQGFLKALLSAAWGRVPMNRATRRRRSASIARRQCAPWHVRRQHTKFFDSYVRHLVRVPLDAPFEGGGPHYIARLHDRWCRYFFTGNAVDCNCCPTFVRYQEPKRS